MSDALMLFDLDTHAAHGITIAHLEVPQAIVTATAMPNITDHRLNEHGRVLASNWKGRALDNLAAIRVARTVVAEDRAATQAEITVLEKYVGFGATELAQALFPVGGDPIRSGWEAIGAELYDLVDERERAYMARSTQYAH